MGGEAGLLGRELLPVPAPPDDDNGVCLTTFVFPKLRLGNGGTTPFVELDTAGPGLVDLLAPATELAVDFLLPETVVGVP